MLRLLAFLSSLLIGIFILRSPQIHAAITHLGNFEYTGAFVIGFLVIMTFTVVPSLAVLITLSETMNPFLLSLLAGAGGMCGDYLLMRYFRSETDELLSDNTLKNHMFLKRVLNSRIFHWVGPLIGSIIVASPFPDEIGITLLGITKLETKKFLLLVFILDTLGVFLIISVGNIFL